MDLSLNLEKLKNRFKSLLLLRNDINKKKNSVNDKITHLKNVYADLSKTTTKKAFLFSLDSFFFQYKLFSVELDNINKFRILLNNRMYCDYYKLHVLITNYIKENKIDLNAENTEFRAFPIYKDLEPFQEYNLDDIRSIHIDIMEHINHLNECYESNKEHILNYNKENRIGFSISNLLNTMEHENMVLKQQVTLFINYLSFFHIAQSKHLKKLLNILNTFDDDIEDNLNSDHTFSVDDVDDADPLSQYDYQHDIENDTKLYEIQEDNQYSIEEHDSHKEDVDVGNITLIPDIPNSEEDISEQDISEPISKTNTDRN